VYANHFPFSILKDIFSLNNHKQITLQKNIACNVVLWCGLAISRWKLTLRLKLQMETSTSSVM